MLLKLFSTNPNINFPKVFHTKHTNAESINSYTFRPVLPEEKTQRHTQTHMSTKASTHYGSNRGWHIELRAGTATSDLQYGH